MRQIMRPAMASAMLAIVMGSSLLLMGCAASTKMSSNTAVQANKQLGSLATLSLMGSLDNRPQGEGYQAACSAAFSQYYQSHGLRGAVVAPSLTALNPQQELNDALEHSQASTLLVVEPIDTEYYGNQADNEYSMVHVGASLYSKGEEGRIWRADISLRPNTHIYWHGDKNETCTRLATDVFQRLEQDGFHLDTTSTPAPADPST